MLLAGCVTAGMKTTGSENEQTFIQANTDIEHQEPETIILADQDCAPGIDSESPDSGF